MERTCQWTVEANGGNPRRGEQAVSAAKATGGGAERAKLFARHINHSHLFQVRREQPSNMPSAPNGAQTFRFGNGNEGGLNLCDRYWCPRSGGRFAGRVPKSAEW